MNPLRIADLVGIDRIDRVFIDRFRVPCTPRILIVTEFDLGYGSNGFGLQRVLEALTIDAGVTNKPRLTLAFRRGSHSTPVTVGTDSYAVLNDFNFETAATPVTVANYDQIWIFGRHTGSSEDLGDGELKVIARFMNSGGGVFATGDHGTIGRPFCGRLPRIRHMREWSAIPMGREDDVNIAVDRIDTVVDPGANNLYEFNDQGDAIPQRIYPHYKVTDTGTMAWQATIHPLLMLPGAPAVRDSVTGNANFTLDIDVLPDHPHESVCYAVTAPSTLGGTWVVGTGASALSFDEFPVSSAAPGSRVPAELVASGVAGGRAVAAGGGWKPPVRPRMFGLVSAWDGRLAVRYPGQTQRPGRIVCDSTWHHYVNVNLNGMGSVSGGVFMPDANLRKIYAYYRNIQAWLQPANRIWCRLWWDLEVVRVHPRFVEELSELEKLKPFEARVSLGREVLAAFREDGGADADRELIDGLLSSIDDGRFADLFETPEAKGSSLSPEALRAGVLGSLLVAQVTLSPGWDANAITSRLKAGPEKLIAALSEAAVQALLEGVEHFGRRAERTLAVTRVAKGLRAGTPTKPAPTKPARPKKA
ncbi:MAG: hypothetical protein ACRC2H_08500 [Silanimonas sp.]